MPNVPQLLTVADVALRLSLAEPAVTALINSGSLLAVNVSTGKIRPRWRVTETELGRWIASRQNVPATRGGRKNRQSMQLVEYV